MQKYVVACEIAGPYAAYVNPATGDCPVSYPVPTASAVRGVFESICWGPAVSIVPLKVEICSPIAYKNYTTNYGGPLCSSKALKKGNNYQLFVTILVNVCYKLYAEAMPLRGSRAQMTEGARLWDQKTTSPGHAYKAIFERRLKRGQYFHTPCLGWREFTPSYCGPLRDATKPCADMNFIIPSLLMEVFPDGYDSKPRFTFAQNVKVCGGVMCFPRKDGTSHVE